MTVEKNFTRGDGNKYGWQLAYDDLYEYEMIINGHEQQFIYEVDEDQFYYRFEDEEPIEMEKDEIPADLVEMLEQAMELE